MRHPQNTTEENLRRVFHQGFAARDLAEPLASFDVTTDVQTVRHFMQRRPLRVVGVRNNGLVTGYVEQDQIDDRPLNEQVIPLSDASVLTTSASFQSIVALLNIQRFVFVTALGQPGGVIVRADLQKAPMRMWLFGMVTLFEMKITHVLQETFPDDSWCDLISESRLNKARALQAERIRRDQSIGLFDCLQLGDKGQMFARCVQLREQYWNQSRRHIEKVVKQLEGLRNNLAHSQDIITENWEAIVRLADTLDALLKVPDGAHEINSLTPHHPEE